LLIQSIKTIFSVYSTHFNFPPIKKETRKRKHKEEEKIYKKKKGGLIKSEKIEKKIEKQ
jgi:hypothetical protein